MDYNCGEITSKCKTIPVIFTIFFPKEVALCLYLLVSVLSGQTKNRSETKVDPVTNSQIPML
jgi:hypothetical protein